MSSSSRSPILKGLVLLIMNPQNMSLRIGLAAKPAMAASTAVPWNRELPKDLVSELDMMTNRTAMKMIRNRMTFSRNRLLIDR